MNNEQLQFTQVCTFEAAKPQALPIMNVVSDVAGHTSFKAAARYSERFTYPPGVLDGNAPDRHINRDEIHIVCRL
jgi:hypothetical protein